MRARLQSDPLIPGTIIPPRPGRPPTIGTGPAAAGDSEGPPHVTSAGVVWVATVATLVLLSLMIVFILQNQAAVRVQYLGLAGSVPLGVALSIAAVTGGFLVMIAGAVRVTQLRMMAARGRQLPTATAPPRARRSLFRLRHHAG